jgi:hypothetical protein
LEYVGVHGRRISKWPLKKWDIRMWTGIKQHRKSPVAISCKQGNELTASVKQGAILDCLRANIFLDKGCGVSRA